MMELTCLRTDVVCTLVWLNSFRTMSYFKKAISMVNFRGIYCANGRQRWMLDEFSRLRQVFDSVETIHCGFVLLLSGSWLVQCSSRKTVECRVIGMSKKTMAWLMTAMHS